MSNLSHELEDEIAISEVAAALWAHKIFILLITSFSIFIAGYYALTGEKKFTATAIFQIEKQNKPGFNITPELGALASLAGVAGATTSDNAVLLERIEGREFILKINSEVSLDRDPFFNTYNPDYEDPLWKSMIKKLIGWQKTKAEQKAIIEKTIIESYRDAIKVAETDGGSISISVTHTNADKASKYANKLMEEMLQLVERENKAKQDLRLSYLSETLADALQDMEKAQQNLKNYALKNSALAQENFMTGSLRLDEIRMERRKVKEISNLLTILEDLIKSENLDDQSYETLRSTHPLVDDIDFRRILGMSETISAWTWPKMDIIVAVSATLKDRINRLDIDIKNIEENAKIYASSAEDLAKLNRDAKIAEATYTVLIEQVKSQSLAAGFKPETFKVFEYATTPLTPSSPKRNVILIIGAILGLALGCIFSLLSSSRRGVYYTKTSLISSANAKLSLKSKSIKRISRRTVSKIRLLISKRRILEVNEAEIKLASKNLIYILNCGGRPTASGAARVLATQSSQSGRKVLLCDTTGQSEKESENNPTQNIADLPILSIDDNMHLMGDGKGLSFFTTHKFNSTLKELMKNFDQVFICSSENDATVGLMALEDFSPSIVLIAGLRNTKKLDIQNIKTKQPIDILFYD